MPTLSQMQFAVARQAFGAGEVELVGTIAEGVFNSWLESFHHDPEGTLRSWGSLVCAALPALEASARAATLGLVGVEDIYGMVGKLIFEIAKVNEDVADVLTVLAMEPGVLAPPYIPGPQTVILMGAKIKKFHLERYLIAFFVAPVIGPALVALYDGLAWSASVIGDILGLGGPSDEEIAAANQALVVVKTSLNQAYNALYKVGVTLDNPMLLACAGQALLTQMQDLRARAREECRLGLNAAPPPFTQNNFDNGKKLLRFTQQALAASLYYLDQLQPLLAPCELQIYAVTLTKAKQGLVTDTWMARVPELEARAASADLDEATADEVGVLLSNARVMQTSNPTQAVRNVQAALSLIATGESTHTDSPEDAVAEGPSRALLCLGAGVLLWGIVD